LRGLFICTFSFELSSMRIKDFLANPGNAFGWLTLFYISFMFLPRVVPQGMFVDGLLYSSISRNLAEGRGSWWLPFFSSSYWIPGIPHDHYFENPPLFFWIQSLFFRLLGDYWWMEKLYATLLLAVNCFLISRIWHLVVRSFKGEVYMSWLPVLFFYLIPIVFWGSAYNLLDSQLLTFCLLAVWALLSALLLSRLKLFWNAMATIFIFLGILIKGPVALYPVTLPFFYMLIFNRSKWTLGILHAFSLLTGVALMFTLLVWLHPPAKQFFIHYWDQRLSAAIIGSRDEGERFGFGRLYVCWILLRENAILIALSALLFLISFLGKRMTTPMSHSRQWSLVFLLLGCSGTLPLILSTRQAAMYLISSLVMFAIAFAFFHYSLISQFLSRMTARSARVLSGLMLIGILIVMVISSLQFGKPTRDTALLEDMQALKPMLPEFSIVGVSDKLMRSSAAHVYLQRYLKVDLTSELDRAKFVLQDRSKESGDEWKLNHLGFELIYVGKKFSVYAR